MHILVIGAAGMIGRKLTARLVDDGALNGRPIGKLTLVDVNAPAKPNKFGGTVEIDVRTFYTLSKRLIGLRSASEQDHDAFWKLVETATVRPLIDSVLQQDAVEQAHRRIESGENVGRVVLTVN